MKHRGFEESAIVRTIKKETAENTKIMMYYYEKGVINKSRITWFALRSGFSPAHLAISLPPPQYIMVVSYYRSSTNVNCLFVSAEH